MEESTIPWFQFKVSDTTRQRLFVPDKIRDVLESRNGMHYVLMGHNDTPYPVLIKLVAMGPGWRCVIEDGWANFLKAHDIRDGDVMEMYYFKGYYFRARVTRNGTQVMGGDVDALEESLEDWRHIADDLDDPPHFHAKMTKPYIRAGRLYVPVTFARENMNGFPDFTHVQMLMGRRIWNAVLRIKYDYNANIVLCFLHRGVRQMIECNSVQPGQTISVEYYGDVTPPLLCVTPNV